MLLQHIADGLLSGAIVALGAIGISFTMKILRFANFSHSELLTWGAYFALIFTGFAQAFSGIPQGTLGPFSFINNWELVFEVTLGPFSLINIWELVFLVTFGPFH